MGFFNDDQLANLDARTVDDDMWDQIEGWGRCICGGCPPNDVTCSLPELEDDWDWSKELHADQHLIARKKRHMHMRSRKLGRSVRTKRAMYHYKRNHWWLDMSPWLARKLNKKRNVGHQKRRYRDILALRSATSSIETFMNDPHWAREYIRTWEHAVRDFDQREFEYHRTGLLTHVEFRFEQVVCETVTYARIALERLANR